MKVTFLVPPCFDHKQPAERTAGCTRVVYLAPNVYELTVAAVVEETGLYSVEYCDFVYNRTTPKKFDAFCRDHHTDVYCIWTVNLSLTTDLAAIAAIRRYHPEVKIVMMGPGPTHYIKRCLVDSNVFVVRGEPEETVRELLAAFAQGNTNYGLIQGLSWRSADGGVFNNPSRPLIADLDRLPFAARHLLGAARYHNPKLKVGPYTTMITSRNCPYKCIYCVPSSLTFAREIEYRRENGRKPIIGYRSPENVAREVAQLASQGYRAIGFMDDNFIWNLERTRAIASIMKRYSMAWGCQARVDAITEPIAQTLADGGCGYVDLGIESFTPEILEYIHKGETVEDIYRAIGLLKKYGVPVKLNVLIGSSPLETRETVLDTLQKAKALDVDQVMFNIVSPFPGTQWYGICKKNGWLKDNEYVPTDVQRESIVNLPNLSANEMEKLLRHNNMRYFLSWKFVVKQLRRFRSLTELKHAAKALKIKLFG